MKSTGAKAFLDSGIFITARVFRASNSMICLSAADKQIFIPVVSYKTLGEVVEWTKRHYDKDTSGYMRYRILILPGLEMVPRRRIISLLGRYEPLVTDKADLPHVCAYFASNSDYFVTTNRKLTQMEVREKVNFKSPREFVEDVLGVEGLDTPNGV